MAKSSRELVEAVRKILLSYDEDDLTVYETADRIMEESAECMEAKAEFEEVDAQMGDPNP